MVSVTERVRQVRQPVKGYINPSKLSITHFQDRIGLPMVLEHPQYIGLAVDYLTRYQLTRDRDKAFEVSMTGARIAGCSSEAENLLNGISDLSNCSIVNAVKLVGYDAVARGGAIEEKDPIFVNDRLCDSIRTMVERSVIFLRGKGRLVDAGFTFEGGYTSVIDRGDGDYLMSDSIWDLKVSRYPPTKEQTLQILIYYILGINTGLRKFADVVTIGLFNPLMNTAYSIKVETIGEDTFHRVMDEVVGIEIAPVRKTNVSTTEYVYSEKVSELDIHNIESDLSNIFEGRFLTSMVPKAEHMVKLDPGSLAAIVVLGTSSLYRGDIDNAAELFTKAKILSEGTGDGVKVDETIERVVIGYFIDYCKDSSVGLSYKISEINKFLDCYPRNQYSLILQGLALKEHELKSVGSVANLSKCMLIVVLCETIRSDNKAETDSKFVWLSKFCSHSEDRMLSSKITSSRGISFHLNRLERLKKIAISIIENSISDPGSWNPKVLIDEIVEI